MRFVVAIALLASCTQFDVLVNAASDEGTVYECTSGEQMRELCYFDDADAELADRLAFDRGGAWSCGSPSRRWPWFTNKLHLGCTYACPAPGVGCNAKQGCFCPGGDYP